MASLVTLLTEQLNAAAELFTGQVNKKTGKITLGKQEHYQKFQNQLDTLTASADPADYAAAQHMLKTFQGISSHIQALAAISTKIDENYFTAAKIASALSSLDAIQQHVIALSTLLQQEPVIIGPLSLECSGFYGEIYGALGRLTALRQLSAAPGTNIAQFASAEVVKNLPLLQQYVTDSSVNTAGDPSIKMVKFQALSGAYLKTLFVPTVNIEPDIPEITAEKIDTTRLSDASIVSNSTALTDVSIGDIAANISSAAEAHESLLAQHEQLSQQLTQLSSLDDHDEQSIAIIQRQTHLNALNQFIAATVDPATPNLTTILQDLTGQEKPLRELVDSEDFLPLSAECKAAIIAYTDTEENNNAEISAAYDHLTLCLQTEQQRIIVQGGIYLKEKHQQMEQLREQLTVIDQALQSNAGQLTQPQENAQLLHAQDVSIAIIQQDSEIIHAPLTESDQALEVKDTIDILPRASEVVRRPIIIQAQAIVDVPVAEAVTIALKDQKSEVIQFLNDEKKRLNSPKAMLLNIMDGGKKLAALTALIEKADKLFIDELLKETGDYAGMKRFEEKDSAKSTNSSRHLTALIEKLGVKAVEHIKHDAIALEKAEKHVESNSNQPKAK